jgi:Glycosyl transferases group 1
MQFLYVGRLDKEKWIEALIICIETLISEKKQFHINIYGQWTYAPHIKSLSTIYPTHITYHGRKHKKDIIWQRSRTDFFIMPSTFLETFWLTACESLLCGIPVIGNKKWWLMPFIDDTLDLQLTKWSKDWEKLHTIITWLIDHNIHKTKYTPLIQSTKENYTTSAWVKSIQHIIWTQRHILMVSDFINYDGGGIETHIQDAAKLLNKHGYQMHIHGHHAPIGKRATLKKLIIMSMNICNIWDSYKITKKIKKEAIWVIWWHSISRVIGQLALRCTPSDMTQIITHHELGLFHPFPSQTTDENQIPDARSLSAFVKAGQTNNFLKKIAIVGKYCMIRCIHKQLQKKIKTHIVPSPRMIPMVRKRHPQANIICIPHFVTVW